MSKSIFNELHLWKLFMFSSTLLKLNKQYGIHELHIRKIHQYSCHLVQTQYINWMIRKFIRVVY